MKYAKIYLTTDVTEEETKNGMHCYGIIHETKEVVLEYFKRGKVNKSKQLKYIIEPIDKKPIKTHMYLEGHKVIFTKAPKVLNRIMLKDK